MKMWTRLCGGLLILAMMAGILPGGFAVAVRAEEAVTLDFSEDLIVMPEDPELVAQSLQALAGSGDIQMDTKGNETFYDLDNNRSYDLKKLANGSFRDQHVTRSVEGTWNKGNVTFIFADKLNLGQTTITVPSAGAVYPEEYEAVYASVNALVSTGLITGKISGSVLQCDLDKDGSMDIQLTPGEDNMAIERLNTCSVVMARGFYFTNTQYDFLDEWMGDDPLDEYPYYNGVTFSFVEEGDVLEAVPSYYFPYQYEYTIHDGLPTQIYEGSWLFLDFKYTKNGIEIPAEEREGFSTVPMVQIEDPEIANYDIAFGPQLQGLKAGQTHAKVSLYFAPQTGTQVKPTVTLEFDLEVLPKTINAVDSPLFITVGESKQLQITGLEAAGDRLHAHSFNVGYSGEEIELLNVDANGLATGMSNGRTYVTVVTEKGQCLEIDAYIYEVTLSGDSYTYNGKAKKPTITSIQGPHGSNYSDQHHVYTEEDFTVSGYKNNKNAGTATAIAALSNTDIVDGAIELPKSFTIKPKSITPEVTLSKTSYTYDGKAKKPAVTSVMAGETALVEGTDYKVSYASGRINAGTYKVTVTLMGNYTGKKVVSFKINPKSITPTVTLSKTSYVYDGSARKPSVTVKNGSTTLVKDTDYTVSYASGRKSVGTYKVTVTLKGNYKGTKSVSFKIVPKGTTISSVTAGTKKFTVKWKKQATQTTGYQIQYSTSSTFASGNKTVTVGKNTTLSKTIKELKAKKKYYVRIRTYKTVSSKKYYSSWSAKKSVTTK